MKVNYFITIHCNALINKEVLTGFSFDLYKNEKFTFVYRTNNFFIRYTQLLQFTLLKTIRMKRSILILTIALSALTFNSEAQCADCTINVSGIDTTSYTLIPGQKLCIDTTGLITGVIVLNGGSICNYGIFKPSSFTYSSGSINNEGNMTLSANINLPSNTTLTNSITGILTITGNATLNGTAITNNGIMNINQNIQFNSGTFTNDNIINVNLLSGAGVITNTGSINSNY